jgi:putative protease
VKKIELLSPARDLESGQAAISAGADAVYIGGSKFGARESAGNSVADIEKLAGYAHRYYSKVYATVNTLLFDNEIDDARDLVRSLYNAGADAIIIQDMAFLEMDLPPIPLFASTQCHNNTPEKIQFLEKCGFSRVILARELSLKEISAIRESTKIDLESFVHGALCVSYSGQCYMSYALGGRSGNRGVCAQPCRKNYTLESLSGEKIDSGHLLSLRDLNNSENLERMIDAGITSFKIEGRLKDANYVKNITSYYRHRLDMIISEKALYRASSGKVLQEFNPDPTKTFNRGYSEYFTEKRSKIGEWRSPKFIGEYIGDVQTAGKDGTFSLDKKVTLNPGDGLSFFDKNGILTGAYVNRFENNTVALSSSPELFKGQKVYRNYDSRFMKTLEKGKVERCIAVDISIESGIGEVFFVMTDEDGTSVNISMKVTEKAKQPEKMSASLKDSFTRIGNTVFEVRMISLDREFEWFIPVSECNRIRRELVDKLLAEREHFRPKINIPERDASAKYPESSLSYRGNVLNKAAERFYRDHGVTAIEPGAESGLSMKGLQVMRTRYCIGFEKGWCGKAEAKKEYTLKDESGNAFRVSFTCGDCGMNIVYI